MLKKIAALLLVPVLLAGCSAAGDVETLLRAPQRSGESAALQKALNNYLGGSATLKYPASGDFLSPFAFGDWDGDGCNDIITIDIKGELILYRHAAADPNQVKSEFFSYRGL